MKIIKCFLALFLIFCLFQAVDAKKRTKPVPMSELTNSSSPSYVPYPYPKTRKKIIENLKYAINKIHKPREGYYYVGRIPKTREIYLNLLEENPVYKIGKILKVKNRHKGMAHDYTWLILIENQEGQNVAGVIMNANGLYSGSGGILSSWEHVFRISEKQVLTILSDYIEKSIENKVKRIERMALPTTRIGDFLTPAWEIELKDGTVYYYSIHKDGVYGISEKKPWKMKKNGDYDGYAKQIPPDADDYVLDTINDQIVILKKYKKKK